MRTFTVPPTEAEENAKRSVKTKRTSSSKTLEMRLEACENDAERAYLEDRLKDPHQELDKGKQAFLYRFSGKMRYKVRARRAHVHVIQKRTLC